MPSSTSSFIRTPAFWAVTIGLGAAYLLAAVALARAGQVVSFGWPGQYHLGASVPLSVGVAYGVAWVLWRLAAGGPATPRRAGWRGLGGGILVLLATVVVVGAYNALDEALHFVPFPGTTAADFYRNFGDECFNYIVKPLAYVMPLGSLVAGPLGWWAGRRAARPAA